MESQGFSQMKTYRSAIVALTEPAGHHLRYFRPHESETTMPNKDTGLMHELLLFENTHMSGL
eukprot:scaffold109809_cov20-Prasinocladus_malaysianus.AAC.1